MEIKEQELLNELNKVNELIEKVKVTRDIIVKAHEIQQLMVIHGKLKEVYPSVHFTNPNGGCGSCVWDFLQQIIPIYDRLNNSAKPIEEVENIVNPFNPEGYDDNQTDNPNVEFQLEEKSGLYKAVMKNEDTIITEAPKPKRGGGRKKKGDNK